MTNQQQKQQQKMKRTEHTAVTYIRHRRKCLSSADRLLLFYMSALLLFQTGSATSSLFNADKQVHSESTDVKNVEWQKVKLSTDVVLPAEHPVVYKEDYVKESNEFDATNLNGSIDKKQKQPGQYGKGKGLKQLNAEKPHKMFADVMPHASNVINNDNVPAAILVSKHELNKIPKKYTHLRKRRNSEYEHVVRKRHPYIQHYVDHWPASNHISPKQNGYEYYPYKSHPVQGNYWNGINGPVPQPDPLPFNIGVRLGADEEERIVWDRFRPVVTTRPSIFHDSNPANADTSFLTRFPAQQPLGTRTQNPTTTPTTTTTTTERPRAPSIFHDSNPANADLSFLKTRFQQQQQEPKQQEQQQQWLNSHDSVKNDKIVFRSSMDDAIDYDDDDDDDVHHDAVASATQVQKATNQESFCAFAIISCCRQNIERRSKCFSDWQCNFHTEDIKQRCNQLN